MAGRSVPPPGMMRHGPFPGGLGPVAHRPLEQPSPHLELLENKVAVQAAEMERLARENQRLAATHVTLRQDLVVVQKELQRLDLHAGSVKAEREHQIKGMLDKMMKMEADLREGEAIKVELQQAHREAQSLIGLRQELNTRIQQMTQELQRMHADIQQIPTMHKELEGLRQEHQRLRSAFEYEKSLNIEKVEQMRAMEKNLVSLAREAEKLRADVLNAEKRSYAPNIYGGIYSGSVSAYAPNQGSGYVDGYGRPQVHMGGGVGEGMSPYMPTGGSGAGDGAASVASGTVSGSGAAGNWTGPYDAVRGAPASAQPQR
ncbi:protein FLX-like 4 [Nymphaea colorata]|nr:protein FLX-like 4 [Nymphaea colorata]XP_031481274.1 protein FLX-like 4 [Nymphaea colorata]XP_031481275.1 protein FLX-like 4 [Nymphaea colorata]